MEPLYYQPAHQLLEQMQRGELSSEALTQSFLERIAAVNGSINAVIDLNEEEALDAARESDRRRAAGQAGPLEGLPMTIKDTWEVIGFGCTAGAPSLRNHRPIRDAAVIARLRAAGAVFLGKTNVPLFASDVQTYNKLFGVTRNPHNPDRTSGGSSGGAAAGLAAGLSPLEVGSDVGGSIRTPAHFCGVFGHKPTHGLVSMRGHIPGPPGTLGQPDLAEGGPMARSARDLELLLRVIAGPSERGAVNWEVKLPEPEITSLKTVRFGLWLSDPQCPIDSELSENYRAFADRLVTLGAKVSEAEHSLLDMERILPLYFNLLGSLMSRAMSPAQKKSMVLSAKVQPILEKLVPITCGSLEFGVGADQGIGDWLVKNEKRLRMRAASDELFKDHDVIIAPISPVTAIAHDHKEPQIARQIRVNGKKRSYSDLFCWIGLATVLGLPATVVPLGKTRQGMPYGLQIIAREGHDLTGLRVATLLEEAGLATFQKPAI